MVDFAVVRAHCLEDVVGENGGVQGETGHEGGDLVFEENVEISVVDFVAETYVKVLEFVEVVKFNEVFETVVSK